MKTNHIKISPFCTKNQKIWIFFMHVYLFIFFWKKCRWEGIVCTFTIFSTFILSWAIGQSLKNIQKYCENELAYFLKNLNGLGQFFFRTHGRWVFGQVKFLLFEGKILPNWCWMGECFFMKLIIFDREFQNNSLFSKFPFLALFELRSCKSV